MGCGIPKEMLLRVSAIASSGSRREPWSTVPRSILQWLACVLVRWAVELGDLRCVKSVLPGGDRRVGGENKKDVKKLLREIKSPGVPFITYCTLVWSLQKGWRTSIGSSILLLGEIYLGALKNAAPSWG